MSVMAEAYNDTLSEGVDLSGHGVANQGSDGSMSVNLWIWILIVGALVALWLLGAFAFRSVNQ